MCELKIIVELSLKFSLVGTLYMTIWFHKATFRQKLKFRTRKSIENNRHLSPKLFMSIKHSVHRSDAVVEKNVHYIMFNILCGPLLKD